jgi:hypothetical protein
MRADNGIDHGMCKCLLAAEVVIQATLGDTCRSQNIVETHALIAATVHLRKRGLQDSLPRGFGIPVS